MTSPVPIEGLWQVHGATQPPSTGILAFEPDKQLTLTVNSQNPDPSPLGLLINSGVPSVPSVLRGTDSHGNPVTLFGCSPCKWNTTALSKTIKISCLAALTNAHIDSWQEPVFRTVELRYPHLHQWMGRKLYSSGPSSAGRPDFSLVLPEDILVSLDAPTQLRLVAGFSSGASLHDLTFKFDHSIYLHFSQPLSIPTILDSYVQPLSALLSLLTDQVFHQCSTSVFVVDPYFPADKMPTAPARLIRSHPRALSSDFEDTFSQLMTDYAELSSVFSAMLPSWFACLQRVGPAVELYMAVRSGRVPSIENRFLFLAQALEVYHSRSAQFSSTEIDKATHKARCDSILAAAPQEHRGWLRDKLSFSNQKTLAARINEILAYCESRGDSIISGLPDFAAKVRHTRNYLTHYSKEPKPGGKIATGKDLVTLTIALQTLVGLCLLKELGLSEQVIGKFIINNAAPDVVSLGDDPPSSQLSTVNSPSS